MLVSLAIVVGVAVMDRGHSSAAEAPRLAEVLDRLGAYLLDYERRLSSLVAEEHSTQILRTRASKSSTRVLQSDYVLVRLPGGLAWLGFRDTFLVDGKAVRDRDARLERLFEEGADDAVQRAMHVVDDNARYNLGDNLIHRTINGPTLTLDLLHPRYRERFSFERHGQVVIEGRTVWKIDFVERERPPIIKTPAGDDQITRGTSWVDPVSGSVTKTYLKVVIGKGSRAEVTVDYRQEPSFGFLVPYEMRETYHSALATITCVSAYRNFRQFQTSARVVAPK